MKTTVSHSVTDEIPWGWMNEERWRLHTFAKYPHKAVKSAILLAAYGFVYKGTGRDSDDCVICFFCGATKSNWVLEDVVRQVHEQLSPSCSMITKRDCSNVPMKAVDGDGDQFLKIYCSLLGNNRVQNSSIQKSKALGNESLVDSSQRNQNIGLSSTQRCPDIAQQANELGAEINIEPSEGQLHSSDTHSYQPGNNEALSITVTSVDMTHRSSVETDQWRSHHPVSELSAGVLPRSAALSPPTSQAISAPMIASNSSAESAVHVSLSSTSSVNNGPPQLSSVAPSTAQATTQPGQILMTSNQITGDRATGNGPSYSDLGIITERPKRYEFALRIKRLQTFTSWPRGHNLKPEELADAGFYYAGYGDCARCFYCGGGLRNWEDEDNVWVEHARWFPKCAFIRQLLGHVFVDTVQQLNREHDKITFEMVSSQLNYFNIDVKNCHWKKDPAIMTVVGMGFVLEDVLIIAEEMREDGSQMSADTLLVKLWEEGKQPRKYIHLADQGGDSEEETARNIELMGTLKERNNLLRQQTVCKICMDKEVAVVFLPCGHLISCSDCAAAMKDCPVCRNHVKGIVRAFFG